MSNTARFSWEVVASGEGYSLDFSTSGSRQEVLFVPYDATERTYEVRVKALSNNGTSDSDWSEWKESNQGTYQGWYRINGATGYDIKVTNYNDPVNGRYADRVQMSLTGNTYTVETLGGTEPTYKWSIVTNPDNLAFLGDNKTEATVELKFKNDILTSSDLVNKPTTAKTFVLQCEVKDGIASYTLQKKITVGDRDECSPVAGLTDDEGNQYTVSKFGGVCWMTQNLRSTYTYQGNVKQEIPRDRNEINDYNAVSYYYPYASETTFNSYPEYGLLYTWGAANIGTATTEAVNAFPSRSSDRQGICPDGWVIPSDYDFNQLEKEIASHPDLYSSQETPFTWDIIYESIIGWRPGEGNTITEYWGRTMKSPIKINNTATNGVSNTDGTGFNALLVGILDGGNASNYGSAMIFWSGSASSATAAWRRNLINSNSGVYRGTTNAKYSSFSVRCKK
jgi:uncharacterized protein (TIGR02145 family)